MGARDHRLKDAPVGWPSITLDDGPQAASENAAHRIAWVHEHRHDGAEHVALPDRLDFIAIDPDDAWPPSLSPKHVDGPSPCVALSDGEHIPGHQHPGLHLLDGEPGCFPDPVEQRHPADLARRAEAHDGRLEDVVGRGRRVL